MTDDIAVVGPWATEKLGALQKYLEFYTKVLKYQNSWYRGTIYVDAFAGAGQARIRLHDRGALSSPTFFPSESQADAEEVQFLNGSPRVALSISNPFSLYVFIEMDPHRVRKLRELEKEFGTKRSMRIQSGDANTELREILQSGIDWRIHRAVIFLDPFGMQVPWDTIDALARTRAIEVLINFPLGMAIQRLIPRSGKMTSTRRQALDAFFGSSAWWDQAYELTDDLFGPKTVKVKDSGKRLLSWYCMRLRNIFGHVSVPRLIKNTRGGHLYYLIWAGPHRIGLKGADAILKKGERIKI